MPPAQTEIIRTYRTLHKALLRAVRYAQPARYVVRDRMRTAFRGSRREDFDAARIARTLEFIRGADASKGLEHEILKGWVHVWWARGMEGRRGSG